MANLKHDAPMCPECKAHGTIGGWISSVGPHVVVDVAFCTDCGHIVGVLPHNNK